jgi:hypothetical protein
VHDALTKRGNRDLPDSCQLNAAGRLAKPTTHTAVSRDHRMTADLITVTATAAADAARRNVRTCGATAAVLSLERFYDHERYAANAVTIERRYYHSSLPRLCSPTSSPSHRPKSQTTDHERDGETRSSASRSRDAIFVSRYLRIPRAALRRRP